MERFNLSERKKNDGAVGVVLPGRGETHMSEKDIALMVIIPPVAELSVTTQFVQQARASISIWFFQIFQLFFTFSFQYFGF